MGHEASARRLRRVVRALSLDENREINIARVSAQFRVRPRTVRRASLLRVTGSASVTSSALRYMRVNGVTKVQVPDAIEWAAAIHAVHPWWSPDSVLLPPVLS